MPATPLMILGAWGAFSKGGRRKQRLNVGTSEGLRAGKIPARGSPRNAHIFENTGVADPAIRNVKKRTLIVESSRSKGVKDILEVVVPPPHICKKSPQLDEKKGRESATLCKERHKSAQAAEKN